MRRSSARVSSTVTATTTSQVLVTDHGGRQELTITNTHATQDVYLDFRVSNGVVTVDPVAVVGEGVLLKANGGSFTTSAYTGPVAMITSAGTATVGVLDI